METALAAQLNLDSPRHCFGSLSSSSSAPRVESRGVIRSSFVLHPSIPRRLVVWLTLLPTRAVPRPAPRSTGRCTGRTASALSCFLHPGVHCFDHNEVCGEYSLGVKLNESTSDPPPWPPLPAYLEEIIVISILLF